MHHVFIVSDGTGRTAARLLEAALTQFPDAEVKTHLRPGLRDDVHVQEIIDEARACEGFILHTVVSRELRRAIGRVGRLHSVETIDLMGPTLAQLSVHLANAPSERPGLFYRLNRAYFQRIEAMEFAFRHDDGQRSHELGNAELVLVGVSRTFKTPVSMYLAFKGWLAANVPIVPGMALPEILDTLPPKRVFCLTTDPGHLARIRRSRHHYLGGVTDHYVDQEQVRMELMHARKIFGAHPDWPVVTITNKPIEEVASEILDLMGDSPE